MKNKDNGPSDCMLTETFQELPMQSVCEITRRLETRFRGGRRAPAARTNLQLVFLKKLDAKLDNGIRGFRTIALMSVLAKWYAAVVVGLLHEEPEPTEWNVEDERGFNCEHMHVLLTTIFTLSLAVA